MLLYIGANLVILSQIHYKLSCRKAKFHRILKQDSQNYLEGHSQWSLFSIPTESISGCMFGANLEIPVEIYEELSHRQAEFPRIKVTKII